MNHYPSQVVVSLHPFLDSSGLRRVGGRGSKRSDAVFTHPSSDTGKHQITSLLISSEHRRLMHAGPTLLTASLNRHYYITGCQKIVRSITCGCVICLRSTASPKPQLLGQIPAERITPGSVFNLDYAGPFI